MTTAAKIATGAGAAAIAVGSLLLKTSSPAPKPAPAPAVQTAAPPAPSAPAPAVAPKIIESATVPPSVTLPRPDLLGYVFLGTPPVQRVPAALSAALAASPVGVARWQGPTNTFWARAEPKGPQCWWTSTASGATVSGTLVYCDKVPTTHVWQPVAFK